MAISSSFTGHGGGRGIKNRKTKCRYIQIHIYINTLIRIIHTLNTYFILYSYM